MTAATQAVSERKRRSLPWLIRYCCRCSGRSCWALRYHSWSRWHAHRATFRLWKSCVTLPALAFHEQPAPAALEADRVTVLQVQGHLAFSGAYTMETQLPEVADATGAVVILRLRGRTQIGSTLIRVLERYAQQLRANGGKLMLAGVSDHVLAQIRNTETTVAIPEEDIFLASEILGGSTVEAMAAAENWQQKRM